MARSTPTYPTHFPVRYPIMFQDWTQLTFLHWRYPAKTVQALVPAPLEVESFDGSAWVGVTPFLLRNLHPVLLPPIPWISHFPETNCRTYVKAPDGTTGVWFFSLDAARLAAVAGARAAYGLPYAWSRMRVIKQGAAVSYNSARRWPDSRAITSIELQQGDAIKPGALENFLTARFRLFSFILGRLHYCDVDHPPWPLKSAEVVSLNQTLTEAAGLPSADSAPIVHFSPGVRVRVARPKRIRL